MNKHELIDKVYQSSGRRLTREQVENCLQLVIQTICEGLATDEEVKLKGLGSFKAVAGRARKGRNPRTGETVYIPPRKRVKFAPSALLAEGLQQ